MTVKRIRMSCSHSRNAVRGRRRLAFTLVEACISLLLMSMLLLGTIDLFVTALRNASDSNALTLANLDAANALQAVVESTREAYFCQLPDETGFPTINGNAASSYTTTYTSGSTTQTVCTGMLVTFPITTPSVSVAYDSGASHAITGIYNLDSPTNTATPGTEVLYYRADSNGAPDAAAGGYLWAYSVSDSGATINRALVKSVAAQVPNAVQFVRPLAQGGTASVPYEVEIKIVCAYYTSVGGEASSEVGNGNGTTSLDGKCVFMRDHEPLTTHENGSTSPTNNHYLSSGT